MGYNINHRTTIQCDFRNNIEMTHKQSIVAKELVANGGDLTKAMEIAGYSKAMLKNPYKVQNSKALQELMNEQLPNEQLFQAHREALRATKFNDFSGEREPDHGVRLRAAVEGYKVKGVGASNSNSVSNTQINIVIEDKGYIPPDNVLGYKPTLKRK